MMNGNKDINEMIYVYYHDYYMKYTQENNLKKAEEIKEKNKRLSNEELCVLFRKNLSPFSSPFAYKAFYKKYYKYFETVYDKFKGEKNFSGRGFIKSVLVDGFKRPQQLATNECLKLYRTNRDLFEIKEESEEIKLAKNIVYTFTYLNNKNISEFLSLSFRRAEFENNYDNDNLNYTVYCFSKAFRKFAEEENFQIDFKKEQSKVKKYPKLLNKIKEKLGDDFTLSK